MGFLSADEQSPEGATETPHLDTKPAQPTEAGYLLVLTDGELVAIDLTQPNWPVLPSPYLKHLDCTTVTAMAHVSVILCRFCHHDSFRLVLLSLD